MANGEKTKRIAEAWAEYRTGAQRLRDLNWTDYLEADDRLWRRYLAAERSILSEQSKAA